MCSPDTDTFDDILDDTSKYKVQRYETQGLRNYNTLEISLLIFSSFGLAAAVFALVSSAALA